MQPVRENLLLLGSFVRADLSFDFEELIKKQWETLLSKPYPRAAGT